jgi:hypothetical protein
VRRTAGEDIALTPVQTVLLELVNALHLAKELALRIEAMPGKAAELSEYLVPQLAGIAWAAGNLAQTIECEESDITVARLNALGLWR